MSEESAKPAGQEPPSAAPQAPAERPWSWLYEMPLFYLLLIAVGRGLFPDDPGFRTANPSPLWLGILLFGLRYGLAAGLASGAVSAGVYALGFRLAGEGFRLHDADFYVLPGLFIVIGAALGGSADRGKHRVASLLSRVSELAGRVKGLQGHIQTQQKALRAIEQQVVSQMSSVVTLYHGSRELGTLDREALLPATLDFFTRALQATKTGLYVPDGGRWVLRDQRGWTEKDAYPRAVAPGEGLVGRAAEEKRVVSLKDLFVAESQDESAAPALQADAIMAAPILDPSGEPAAVLAVQAMPFLRFNSAAVNLLTLLAEWGSESLAKCLQVAELKSRSILDEELPVHSAGYFRQRAEQEFLRSRRYALPFSVLLVGGLPDPAVPPERRRALLTAVARALRETVRDIDVVARTPMEEALLGVLLMTATREKAEELRGLVVEALARLDLPAAIRLGVGAYKPAMSSVEELLEQAKADLG